MTSLGLRDTLPAHLGVAQRSCGEVAHGNRGEQQQTLLSREGAERTAGLGRTLRLRTRPGGFPEGVKAGNACRWVPPEEEAGDN